MHWITTMKMYGVDPIVNSKPVFNACPVQLHLKRRNQLISAGLQVATASRPTSSARQKGTV
jgi:hypothetical protein